jgi:hypothetical protein
MFAITVVRYTEQSKCKLSCSKRDSRNRLSAHLNKGHCEHLLDCRVGYTCTQYISGAHFMYFCNPNFAIPLFLDGVIHF